MTSSLPSCPCGHTKKDPISPSLPGSRLTIFYRDASSALLQLVKQWLSFTFSRSHDFRTSRCAGHVQFLKIHTHTTHTLWRCPLLQDVEIDLDLEEDDEDDDLNGGSGGDGAGDADEEIDEQWSQARREKREKEERERIRAAEEKVHKTWLLEMYVRRT